MDTNIISRIIKLINSKINRRMMLTISAVILAGVFAYIYKSSFIAAIVNGRPISRFAVIGELEKNSGKQALDLLITQKLINSELDKKKITVTDDEIFAEVKKIEDQITEQGSTLDQTLKARGMTTTDLKNQVSLNLRIEKLFADKAQVSDAEVVKYKKDQKLTVAKGQEAQFNNQIKNQLKSARLNQAVQDWVSTLRLQASIHYFVSY